MYLDPGSRPFGYAQGALSIVERRMHSAGMDTTTYFLNPAIKLTVDATITVPNKKDSMDIIMEMEIFFREFKDQLQKYLNIHRKVWEEISDIKERKFGIFGHRVQLFCCTN